MTPGVYLQKRRAIAGHTIQSLERDLSAIDGLGRLMYHDNVRAQLRLIDAEANTNHLSIDEAHLTASVIPIDADIYRQLVRLYERKATAPFPRLCRNCGASDKVMGRHPFSGIPGRDAEWVEADLCSLCAEAINGPEKPQVPEGALITIIADTINEGHRARRAAGRGVR